MDEIYIKDFDKWNAYQKTLDKQEFDGFCREREVWWCALGVNIGSEQDGKNDLFERPVLIIKKIRKDLLRIIPLTSKIDDHDDRITATIAGERSQILLSQARTISSKRLLRKIGYVRIALFQEVIIRLVRSILDIPYESETPPIKAGNLGARRPR